jgi:hypothetical protein
MSSGSSSLVHVSRPNLIHSPYCLRWAAFYLFVSNPSQGVINSWGPLPRKLEPKASNHLGVNQLDWECDTSSAGRPHMRINVIFVGNGIIVLKVKCIPDLPRSLPIAALSTFSFAQSLPTTCGNREISFLSNSSESLSLCFGLWFHIATKTGCTSSKTGYRGLQEVGIYDSRGWGLPVVLVAR